MQLSLALRPKPAAPKTVSMTSSGFRFEAMASACEVRVAGMSQRQLQNAAQAAIDEVRRIEVKYSRYRADSIVSRINAAAGSDALLAVDDETAQLLGFAAQLFESSAGLFDITSGVLRRAWDFRACRVPEPAAVSALLELVGWQKVVWTDHTLTLPIPGMEIDFGGFGKEYAADRAHAVLATRGVRHGYVNLGGDIRVLGAQPDGTPWRIGIQHPRAADRLIASLDVSEGALASSGDYERFFEHGGRRYCHILDPRTGWPVDAWQSISVFAPVCVAAGAMSTIAMLKRGAALEFLREQGAAFLAIDAQGQRFQDGA
jgi:FAD:protein FMN transferase